MAGPFSYEKREYFEIEDVLQHEAPAVELTSAPHALRRFAPMVRNAEQNATPPYDALLVLSFVGPEGPDDVMPFLENVVPMGGGAARAMLAVAGR